MARRKNKIRRRGYRPGKINISAGANFIIRLLPFILTAALIGVAAKAGIGLLCESDYFSLKNINIKGNDAYAGLSSILSKLDSKKGSNIFNIDLKSAESYIESNNPKLNDVLVRRLLPDTIEVSYKIRKPFLQVESEYFYQVCEDMVILPDRLTSPDPMLTTVTGIEISERRLSSDRRSESSALRKAVSLLKEIKDSGFSNKYKIVRINVHDANNPAIFIEDETRIEIGEEDFKKKQKLLEEILADLKAKSRGAKVIDLRFEDVVVIPR